MFLVIAGLLFAAFVGNVVAGASGIGAVLGDVGEMVTLFAASLAFTVAILKREGNATDNNNKLEP